MVQVSLNKQITISFPSIEGSQVVINDVFSGQAFQEIQKVEGFEMMYYALAKMIISWNLEDEQGQQLAPSVETLKRFDFFDVQELFYQTSMGRRFKELEEKKTLVN